MTKKLCLLAFFGLFTICSFGQTSPELQKYFDSHLGWGNSFSTNFFASVNGCSINIEFKKDYDEESKGRFYISLGGDSKNGNSIPIYLLSLIKFSHSAGVLKIEKPLSNESATCFDKFKFRTGQTINFKFKPSGELSFSSNGMTVVLDNGLD